MAEMPKVAVVDDDAGVLRSIGRLLSAAGYLPSLFRTAEALLAADVVAGVCCLILDVQLPGRSGFEVHRALSEAGKNIPIVFMSAHDEPATRRRAQQAGAVAFLAKPFEADALLSAIARARHSG